ncbi:hypothetical protein D9619_011361 [Psilocybe cf. subviscida]|uniref:Uncharacterized protein n=1 Tax=Psilocybe cf. subviscida TaxID=2480587 RepID=A0A8H5F5Q5_9AGAR|nr:hypothetical protein D9619_011361 [Psilocybe cf. subviscida]
MMTRVLQSYLHKHVASQLGPYMHPIELCSPRTFLVVHWPHHVSYSTTTLAVTSTHPHPSFFGIRQRWFQHYLPPSSRSTTSPDVHHLCALAYHSLALDYQPRSKKHIAASAIPCPLASRAAVQIAAMKARQPDSFSGEW